MLFLNDTATPEFYTYGHPLSLTTLFRSKPAEDIHPRVQRRIARVVEPRHRPVAIEARRRDLIGDRLRERLVERRHRRIDRSDRRAGRNVAEPALDLCLRGRRVDFAGDRRMAV